MKSLIFSEKTKIAKKKKQFFFKAERFIQKKLLPFSVKKNIFEKFNFTFDNFFQKCNYYSNGYYRFYLKNRIYYKTKFFFRIFSRLVLEKKFKFLLKKKNLSELSPVFFFFESKNLNFSFNKFFKIKKFKFKVCPFLKFKQLKNLENFFNDKKNALFDISNFANKRAIAYSSISATIFSFFLGLNRKKNKYRSLFSLSFKLKLMFAIYFWNKINRVYSRYMINKVFPTNFKFKQAFKIIDRGNFNLSKFCESIPLRYKGIFFNIQNFNIQNKLNPIFINNKFLKIFEPFDKRWNFFFNLKDRELFFKKSKEFLEIFSASSEYNKNFLLYSGKKFLLFKNFFGEKKILSLKKKKFIFSSSVQSYFFLVTKKFNNNKNAIFYLRKKCGKAWSIAVFKILKKKKFKKLGFYAKARIFGKKRLRLSKKLIFSMNDSQFFVNCIMRKGNKLKALNIFLKAYFLFAKETYTFLNKGKKKHPMFFFKKAITEITPPLVLIEKTIAGRKQKIPYVATLQRRRRIAIRWIVLSAKNSVLHKNKPFFFKLAFELLDILKHRGLAFKRKKEYTDEYAKGRFFIRRLRIV